MSDFDGEPNAAARALADEPMMRWFVFEHLPPHLQSASAMFHAVAVKLVTELPRSAERTVSLRKLLESKDAAVRAAVALAADSKPEVSP